MCRVAQVPEDVFDRQRGPCDAAREFDECILAGFDASLAQSRMLKILQLSMLLAKELCVLLRKVASMLHRSFHGCAYKVHGVSDEQDCVWEEVVLRLFTHLPKSAVDHHVFH